MNPSLEEIMEVDPPPTIQDIFPFFELPQKALMKALRHFECVDLIDFSLCSEACKRLTQATKHGINAIDLSVMLDNTMIQLRSGMESRAIIDFESIWQFKPHTARFINGTCFNACKQGPVYYCRDLSSGVTTELQTLNLTIKPMSDYLIELFGAPFSIVVRPDGHDMRKVFPEFIECDSLEVAGEFFMDPDDMKYLFETVKPDKNFNLKVHDDTYFLPDEVPLFFDVNNLEMMNTASRLTGNMFLRFYCNRIRLSYCYLKAADFEAFVLQWYFSTAKRLEYVEVWHRVQPGKMTFRNCNLRKPDPSLRGRFYNNTPSTYIDCSSGYDVIREDGTIATILDYSGSFHFIVWNVPFPEYCGTQQFLG